MAAKNKIISRKDAIEKGLPSYFTGLPCKYGHIAKRGVSAGNCYQCEYEKGKTLRAHIKAKRLEALANV